MIDSFLSFLIFFSLTNFAFSTLMRSRSTDAGSSLGSCGTSFPCIAHLSMLFLSCFPFILILTDLEVFVFLFFPKIELIEFFPYLIFFEGTLMIHRCHRQTNFRYTFIQYFKLLWGNSKLSCRTYFCDWNYNISTYNTCRLASITNYSSS